MPIKAHKGFTLIELLVVVVIFGMMVMSLAAIYGAANGHMFQGYRQNTIKSGASVAIKAITARLTEATQVDSPAPGLESNTLLFATNVDNITGCFPMNPNEPVLWHEFCHVSAVTTECPYGNCLYYHTGVVATAGACPSGPTWDPSVYPACGSTGMGTKVLLASFVQPPPGGTLFSRTQGRTLVDVNLRVYWDPSVAPPSGNRNLRGARSIDTTLRSTVHLLSAGQ